jgi:hypothetical protein
MRTTPLSTRLPRQVQINNHKSHKHVVFGKFQYEKCLAQKKMKQKAKDIGRDIEEDSADC